MLDQEHGLAAERGGGADEFDGVVLRIGVWKAAGVFRDTAVVGEVGDGPDVSARVGRRNVSRSVATTLGLASRKVTLEKSCNMSGSVKVTK
ncbi:hypothetical protein ACVW0J_000943 [Bradyrhizobium sp. i1.7.7]